MRLGSVVKTNPKKPTRKKREPGFIVWGIPRPLRRRFKSRCAANGKSMREVIEHFMESYAGKE